MKEGFLKVGDRKLYVCPLSACVRLVWEKAH